MPMHANLDRCNGCGKCVETCSTGAIHLVLGKVVIDKDACTLCEACIAACPSSAISVITLPVVQIVPVAESPTRPPAVLTAASPSSTHLASLARMALAFIEREIVPRLADTLVADLERQLSRPASLSAVIPVRSAPRSKAGSGRAYRYRRRGQLS